MTTVLHRAGAYVCRVAIPVDAPERVLIFPWGDVEFWDRDKTFIVDETAAATTLKAFVDRGVDLPFDYEHQSMGGKFASPDGKAIAAGWIKSLEVVPNEGIYANVEWTEAAAKHIGKKEYRYLSPVFYTRKDDSRLIEVVSVALTNTPALRRIPAIVSEDSRMDGMDRIYEWRYRLNLPETATPEEIVMELQKLVDQFKALLGNSAPSEPAAIVASIKLRLDELDAIKEALAKELGIAKDGRADAFVAAIAKAKTDAAEAAKSTAPAQAELSVLTDRVKRAEERAQSAEDRLTDRDAEERIAKALSAGKLTEADLSHAEHGPYFKSLARDGKAWAACIDRLPSKAPKDGPAVKAGTRHVASATGGRAAVIASAKSEFADNADKIPCSVREYVDEALRESNEAKLTEDEAKSLSV
ncbi:MAG: hypothetical protein HS101_16115 [Planctomycetia bacterium]|nr:hypothetical protein [Planctomycetia bacterium]MCC7315127.1 hypothetical protein [Planctomycetota bacterium]